MSDLQRQLLDTITTEEDQETALSRMMRLLLQAAAADALVVFRRNLNGQLVPGPRLHRKYLSLRDVLLERLAAWCEVACRENCVQTHTVDHAGRLTAVAVPVAVGGASSESLCAVLRTSENLTYSTAILQLASAYLSLWRIGGEASRAQWEADRAAALIEIVSHLQTCDRLQDACQQLVRDMQKYLDCRRVAVGLRTRNGSKCRLQAISGVAQFDRRAELVRRLEAAMQEAMVRDRMTVWPTESGPQPATLAHKKLARLAEAPALITAPLKDAQGDTLGAWLLMGDQTLAHDTQRHHVIQATAPHVASCLQVVRRSQRGRLFRTAERIWNRRRTWQVRAAATAAAALGGLLLLPLPYRITCDVTLQPVTRRFVAAPFSGTLERTLCQPGQGVTSNELLAQLDGREIRWELAGLIAEHQRADKERQVALAAHDTATAQQAQLRMDRLALRIRLLEFRSENLDIRSPIDGVVIRGDLTDAIGVPVTTGQTLFEVAPLTKMKAELAIPDDEIPYVTKGSRVTLRLDAQPGRDRHQTLQRIEPVAETIDGRNVFVGQVPLDNSDNRLRPGMAGRATITGPRRPLAWNLFHKPWFYLLQFLGV